MQSSPRVQRQSTLEELTAIVCDKTINLAGKFAERGFGAEQSAPRGFYRGQSRLLNSSLSFKASCISVVMLRSGRTSKY